MRRLPLALFAVATTFACGVGGSSVTDPDPLVPTTLTVSAPMTSLDALGQTVLLSASVLDQNGALLAGGTVTWSSSAPEVAVVLASGLVVALAPGSTSITATSGTLSATTTMDVTGASGSQIVHIRRDAAGFVDVYRMNEDGSGVVLLTSTGTADQAFPRWAPDRTAIAYARRTTQATAVMDPDGGDVRTIATGDFSGRPRWSPDSEYLAYEAESGLVYDIFRIRRDGTSATNLTGGAGGGSPAWSPDGARIAFARHDTILDQIDVWLMNADGTAPVNLMDTVNVDITPVDWSPDGGSILGHTSDRHVVLMDLSGPSLALDTVMSDGYDPSWSPDGSRILFTRGSDLFIADADGTNQTQVTSVTTGSAARGHWFKQGS